MNAQHTTETRALEAFALAHYEAGGHWVYETHGAEDYLAILAEAGGDMDRARAALRADWERTESYAAEIRSEAF